MRSGRLPPTLYHLHQRALSTPLSQGSRLLVRTRLYGIHVAVIRRSLPFHPLPCHARPQPARAQTHSRSLACAATWCLQRAVRYDDGLMAGEESGAGGMRAALAAWRLAVDGLYLALCFLLLLVPGCWFATSLPVFGISYFAQRLTAFAHHGPPNVCLSACSDCIGINIGLPFSITSFGTCCVALHSYSIAIDAHGYRLPSHGLILRGKALS